MAVLPEVDVSPDEVKIDDIQMGDSGFPLTKKQEELCRLIWKKRHVLMGKKEMPFHLSHEASSATYMLEKLL